MIDVPVRVKDALRSGDYRKNYRIIFTDSQKTSHTFEEPEIDIRWVEGPMGDYCTTSEIALDIPNDIAQVEIVINSPVTAFGWDTEYYISQMADPEIFDYNAGTNTTTITMRDGFRGLSIHGNHIIPSDSIQGLEFTYVRVTDYLVDGIIENDKLVAESVRFDERMCSDTELKFGLCEGTSVEFQYFDFPNIRGRHISIELDVEYKDENNALAWYTIPMGKFEVDECSRQASTGIIKATGYNKLQSNTLDSVEYVNDLIRAGESGITGQTSVYKILDSLLSGFSIDEDPPTESDLPSNTYSVVNGVPDGVTLTGAVRFNKESTGYYIVWVADFDYRSSLQSVNGYYKYRVSTQGIYQYIKSLLNYANLYYGTDHHTLAYAAEVEYANIGGEAKIKNTSNEKIDEVRWFAHQRTYVDLGAHDGGYFVFATNNDRIHFTIPVYVLDAESAEQPPTHEQIQQMYTNLRSILNNVSICVIKNQDLAPLEKTKITENDVTSGVTLRDLQSAVYELNCQYGKLDRVTDLFSGIELNDGSLYPRDNLYPANDLLPMGTSEAGYPAMYSKLWADEGNVRTFRYLIITYKAIENGQEVEKKLQRTVNTHGTDDYNMSDNWLFRNLVWTAEQVGAYADAMVEKMRNISWFPFEMWCAGLPYLEAGDAIEIAMQQGTYKSYVLRRNLNGIQNLQDEMINGTLDIF